MRKLISRFDKVSFLSIVFLLFWLLYFNHFIINFFLGEKNILNLLVSGMKYEQFFFSYNFEYMKRGLVGTLFDILDIKVTKPKIFLFMTIQALLLFFLLKKVIDVYINDDTLKRIILLIFIISPFTIMHLGFDFARFDIINLNIALTVMVLLKERIMLLLIPCLLSLALLIHEAFLFLQLPMILSIIYLEFKLFNLPLKVLALSIATPTFTIIITLLFGNIEPSTFTILENLVGSKNDLYILEYDIKDNILLTLSYITTPKAAIYLVIGTSLCYLYYKFLLGNIQIMDKHILLLKYSFIPVIPMFILGVDYYRWISIIAINFFIVYIYYSHLNLINPSQLFVRSKLYMIIFFTTLLGPVGVVNPVPYATDIVKAILL